MTRLFFISILLLLTSSIPSQAATAAADDDFSSQTAGPEESAAVNEVRWYQVELLIYKQKSVSTEINEVWPKDITLSYPDNWDTLKTPAEYEALYQKKSVVNTPFILLDSKQFQFSKTEKKLQLNRNEILFHGAWRQSLTQNLDQKAENPQTPILIHGGNTFDDHMELEGSITLSLQRYLHVDINLWLTRFVPVTANPVTPATPAVTPAPVTDGAAASTPAPVALTWPELPAFPLLKQMSSSTTITTPAANTTAQDTNATTPATAPAVVAAEKKSQVDEIALNKQSRRMRSYETHYIDHPKFGILIRMTPLDTNTMLPIPPKN